MAKTEIEVAAPDAEALRLLLGTQDETRRLVERELAVTVTVRGESLVVQGEPEAASRAANLLEQPELAVRRMKTLLALHGVE